MFGITRTETNAELVAALANLVGTDKNPYPYECMTLRAASNYANVISDRKSSRSKAIFNFVLNRPRENISYRLFPPLKESTFLPL